MCTTSVTDGYKRRVTNAPIVGAMMARRVIQVPLRRNNREHRFRVPVGEGVGSWARNCLTRNSRRVQRWAFSKVDSGGRDPDNYIGNPTIPVRPGTPPQTDTHATCRNLDKGVMRDLNENPHLGRHTFKAGVRKFPEHEHQRIFLGIRTQAFQFGPGNTESHSNPP